MTYKTGISGAGPKKLRKLLDKLEGTLTTLDGDDREESMYTALFNHTASATVLGTSTVDTLIKGIIYEPTNYASYDSENIAIAAEHTKPKTLVESDQIGERSKH